MEDDKEFSKNDLNFKKKLELSYQKCLSSSIY